MLKNLLTKKVINNKHTILCCFENLFRSTNYMDKDRNNSDDSYNIQYSHSNSLSENPHFNKVKASKTYFAKKSDLLNNDERYHGYSLVEMIISVAIVSVVMLIIGLSLNSLLMVSFVTSARMEALNQTDFAMELIKRTIKQSNPSNIFLFDSSDYYYYESGNNVIARNPNTSEGYPSPLYEGEANVGNEIHLLPANSDRWICIGYFTDNQGNGYLFKTSYKNLTNHESCFDSATSEYKKNIMKLNTSQVNFTQFDASYFSGGSSNVFYRIKMTGQPTKKYGNAELPRTIEQDLYITTNKINNI